MIGKIAFISVFVIAAHDGVSLYIKAVAFLAECPI